MKRLLKIAAALAVLVVLVVVALVLMLDSIAAQTIRRGGTYALGVETTVDEVDIGLGSEIQASLGGLAVANPAGFEAERFLGLGAGALRFPRSGIFADVVTVPELTLDAIEINLERRDGKTNYGVILENLERMGGGGKGGKGGGSGGAEKAPGGKRFAIDRIVLTDIDATIDLLPLGGEAARVTLRVPEIVIEDLSDDMSTAEIFSVVIRTLLAAVLQNAGDLLPADMLKDLSGRLGDFGGVAFELTGGAADASKELLSTGQKILEENAEKLGGAAEEALKGLGGILKKKE